MQETGTVIRHHPTTVKAEETSGGSRGQYLAGIPNSSGSTAHKAPDEHQVLADPVCVYLT
jgi:hypothetical protein